MDVEQMKYYKKKKGYTLAQLSEYSDVPLGTVQKIFSGETKCPRYETMQALEEVLRPEGLDRVCEELFEYGVKEGNYTLDDYYALPDDKRVELIDGTFYDMAAPSISHQAISMHISYVIRNYIADKKGKCMVFAAPVDVQLDCDEHTMVQPDVLVVCDLTKLHEKVVYGAPDFVIEILSPSTKKKDVLIKTQKYENAGVREYWMIDTKRKKIMAYYFEDDITPVIYGFEAEIPVAIYDGELRIDFKEIAEMLNQIGGNS